MSEMVRNRGIVKELYADIENPEEKIIALHFDTGIPFDDLIWLYEGEPEWDYIEHDNFSLINGRLFDVSSVPNEYDSEGESYEVKKIDEGKYEINLYYYNGGGSMEEIISEGLDDADNAFVADADVGWRPTDNVRLRIVLSKYDDETVKYTYEGRLDDLIDEDDGGMSGYMSVQAEAADVVDGDNSRWEDWQIETVEYKEKL